MKRITVRAITMAFLSFILVAFSTVKASAQNVYVSYQTFYDELSPYGQWIYDPEYGNVWVPNEDGDFRPYATRGRWAMTEYGNTWVSDDPWGWACYHYGRWTYNPYYGWVWIPGYEWAPAWVSWRFGGGYCGWAPLGPGISVGMSFNCPDSWWVFVGPRYLYYDNCYSYWRGPSYNRTYIRQTTIINNVYVDNYSHVQYNYGPRSSAIQQYTGQPVQVFRVSQVNRPGGSRIQQNTVNIYRPMVNQNTIGSARPMNVMQAPRNIGRPEQAAYGNPNVRPAFRQEMSRNNTMPQNGNTGVVGPRNNNVQQNQGYNPRNGNVQPADNWDRNNGNRGGQQPGTGNPRVNNYDANPGRPQPQRFEPQSQPQSYPQRGQPQRFEPQNQPQSQPQRSEPQVQPQRSQPQPQRFEPQRSEPQRSQPQGQPQAPARGNEGGGRFGGRR